MADEQTDKAEEQTDKPELEIQSDENWKDRVKAEDARLDAEQADPSPPDEPEAEPAAEPAVEPAVEPGIDDIDLSQLPPADFSMLVQSFSTQAMVALGVIPNPVTGAAQPQPALAKHFIDLLSVIEEKTEGNLSNPERNLLVDSLHHLRMAYVELSKKSD